MTGHISDTLKDLGFPAERIEKMRENARSWAERLAYQKNPQPSPSPIGTISFPPPHVSAKQTNRTTKQKPSSPSVITALPYWADNKRGMPNTLARSSLFRIGNNKQKRLLFPADNPITLASYKNFSLSYCGEELRQDDLDLWLQIVHLYRLRSPEQDLAEFTAHSMLRQLEWPTSKNGYQRLRATMRRLKNGVVQISENGKVDLYHLLDTVSWFENEAAQRVNAIRIRLAPKIINLFSPHAYTQMDWDQRRRLSPMAKWVHAFYSTHGSVHGAPKPYPLKLTTLHSLCGSSCQNLTLFRYSFTRALEENVQVGFFKSYRIDDHYLVHVDRALPDNVGVA